MTALLIIGWLTLCLACGYGSCVLFGFTYLSFLFGHVGWKGKLAMSVAWAVMSVAWYQVFNIAPFFIGLKA
jgi:hypothetical protein